MKQFYKVTYTIGDGDAEYGGELFDSFDARPSDAQCFRMVAESFWDTKPKVRDAIREYKSEGFSWIPDNVRIVKSIGAELDYKRMVHSHERGE